MIPFRDKIPLILLSALVLFTCDPSSSSTSKQQGADSQSPSIPSISKATYDYAAGVLMLTGIGLPTKLDGWDLSKLTITGHGTITLKVHSPNTVASEPSASSLTITLRAAEKSAVNAILDKNGTKAADNTAYKLEAKSGVLTGSKAFAVAKVALTVLNVPIPKITRASYNYTTGILVLTGLNFPTTQAAWDFTKFKLQGATGMTLSAHGTGSNDYRGSAWTTNRMTITAKGTSKKAINKVFDKNGASASDGTVYNIDASAAFAGNAMIVVVVSGVPTITSATYHATKGKLILTGLNFPTTQAAWDFTRFKLQGHGTTDTDLTLNAHGTGPNDYQGSAWTTTGITITARGNSRTAVNGIFNNNGKDSSRGITYNIIAAAGFIKGAPADDTTGVTVSGH